MVTVVEIITNQYKAGVAGYLSVLTAQATLLALEREPVDMAGRRMAAAVRLIRAPGGGWSATPGKGENS